ncbi:MAG: thiamine pyrophosphate-dependent enzyme [Rhodospirillales bacterium]|nr:thiamine pyrophosphate-dependent enzyme [Rhodospirillales bacterium]
MNAIVRAQSATKHLMSGNEAVARAVWEAGVKCATAYPGTPSTEILENVALYPDVSAQWSVNEKVSLEVAIGASVVGARAFCAMKHVGMNVASDALMSQTLAGVDGGLVIAIADDVGLSSSQNEQDSRFWGRFGHLPILEPADSQEAYEMTIRAFDLSEQFNVPVILRMTTRVCHVKTIVKVGVRKEHEATGFEKNPEKWIMIPAYAKGLLVSQLERDVVLAEFAETFDLNRIEEGSDKRVGILTSGPAYMHVKEAFPDVPVMKLALTYPLAIEAIKSFAATVEKLVIVEETEPLIEQELKAAGLEVYGKDIMPRTGELTPPNIMPGIYRLLGEEEKAQDVPPLKVFPRPPTMCVGCPHLSVYYSLAKLHKKTLIAGDIGCYTLGAGHPWNALDTVTCMGASIGMASGMDIGRGEADEKKAIVAVIGDSTFLHMGMQGLLNLTYNQGNVTLLLLDNTATGMTGGQDHAGTGRGIDGAEAPKIDFRKLVEALGIKPERIRECSPYELPVLYRALKEETAINEPSVIITNEPCVLIDDFRPSRPFTVKEEDCTGCANCLNVGCPAIQVTRRETEVKANGKEVEKAWVQIESSACTGCDLCPKTCGPDAIVQTKLSFTLPVGG